MVIVNMVMMGNMDVVVIRIRTIRAMNGKKRGNNLLMLQILLQILK